jgi:hypothetical protein
MAGLVCVACKKFFRVKKQGISIEEGMPLGGEAAGMWGSYKLWSADLFECPGCHVQIVAGFGQRPIAEHFQTDYDVKLGRYQPIGRVDDCGGAKP